MNNNIQNASPFKTKQLGDKLNKIIERSPKLKLTRDEREMIHLTALFTFTFTLIGAAVLALALGLSL
jgi:hypothetical protein